MEEKSIQLWPSGTSVRYTKQDEQYNIIESSKEVTAFDIQVEELARLYQERYVLCCDSCLVDQMLQLGCDGALEGFSLDDIENTFADVESMDTDERIAYIREYTNDHTLEELSAMEESELTDIAREVASDNPAEIFEWWRVDRWLAAQLAKIGCPVIRNGYGEWYGRTTTGQGMLMDGVLQRVARNSLNKDWV